MAQGVVTKTKVWFGTIEQLIEKAGVSRAKLSEELGFSQSWYYKKFNGHGYGEFNKLETMAICSALHCTTEELTALPVAKETNKPKAEGASTAGTGLDDLISEIQCVQAEIANGIAEAKKDKATATKQDDLYELIRNVGRMLHSDIMTLAAAVKGDTT